MSMPSRQSSGFTLIELSIVLVIIGLIVGGVLVGRDLISAATIRDQLNQMEKYQLAVNIFKGKYDYLPGDIPNTAAAQFGFQTRSGARGDGNGDMLLEGSGPNGMAISHGELSYFWSDLFDAGLIDGDFATIRVPPAKIGQGNYIYVYTNGVCCGSGWVNNDTNNYMGISAVTAFTSGGQWPTSNPGLAVQQAYNIDAKAADGQPTAGNIKATYAPGCCGGPYYSPSGVAATSATCYDTTTNAYSMSQNNGAGINCALSFAIK